MTLQEFKDCINTDIHAEINKYEEKVKSLKAQLV